LPIPPANFKKLAQKDTLAVKKVLSHAHALARLAAKGVDVATVIDVGAAKGDWSLLARKFWPDAHLHLLEAKEYWRRDLEKLAAKHRPASISMKAVCDRPGKTWFPIDGPPYAGAAFKDPGARDDLSEVEATTIDHEVEASQLVSPYAIKLDTHGAEVDILAGARETLKETSLLCIETYNFIGQKQFPAMILHLEALGFRCADLSEPVFRKADAALWQIDFYFLRADHPTFDIRGFDG